MIDEFRNEYDFLSNFYICDTDFFGNNLPSVEHFFQLLKGTSEAYLVVALRKVLPEKTIDQSNFVEVYCSLEPAQAKKFGRLVRLRPDWDQVKDRIMANGVMAKFRNNLDLRDKLIKTGNIPLVEGNWWHDNYWGDCRCYKCVNIPGRNMLGTILMATRAYFQVLGYVT